MSPDPLQFERLRAAIFETLDNAFNYPCEADLDDLARRLANVALCEIARQ